MDKEKLIQEGYSFGNEIESSDIKIIHNFLSNYSTWCLNIPKEIVEKSVYNSICFAIRYKNSLVAFARIITDKSTFANLVDVFVLNEHRNKGLATWLMQEVLTHPDLLGLRRFTLSTTTAKFLYAKYGFQPLVNPASFMEIYKPDIYS